MTDTDLTAAASGTFTIGGDLEVNRLGFGAMRITGPGIWGDPADPDEAVRVLQRAVELGVNFIDTADSYGPDVSELLIRKALHPYPAGVVVATKAGLTRQGPNIWTPVGRPNYLRQQVEMCLRHLGVDRIDVMQFHRPDPDVPFEDSVGELAAMQAEGKIHHVGLSNVTVEQLDAARGITEIVTVQNRFNLGDHNSESVLDACEERGIGFIPWAPLSGSRLSQPDGPLAGLSAKLGATPSQLSIAWLLKRSPVMLPIPGTSSVEHLEDNVAGASVALSDEDFEAIAAAV